MSMVIIMKKLLSLILSLIISLTLSSCLQLSDPTITQEEVLKIYSLENLPEYSGNPYIEVNGNIPYLTIDDSAYTSFEQYADLDFLNRCGVCVASIGPDIMPTEERESIGSVKPSGWQTAKYDFVDGKYLYNRCHLIGFQLTGENANEKNLITGTRSMNVLGMLPFENMIAQYVKETKNHVLYRVTPCFEEDNLLSSGVLLEALSVEDEGQGISFCVYCYNAEPGVLIDYATGENYEDIYTPQYPKKDSSLQEKSNYVLNTSSKKIHLPDCSGAQSMSEKNKEVYYGLKQDLLNQGFTTCGSCNP